MATHLVSVLAARTPGDGGFYARWTVFGRVLKTVKPTTDILVVDQKTMLDRAFFKRHPSIKYVCSATTGHTHLKHIPDYITLVTLRGETKFLGAVTSVSEWVYGLIFSCFSRSSIRKRMSGKVITVIGSLGRIGSQVCRIAESYGMHVLEIEKHNTTESIWKACLSHSDIVTIHVPEQASTRHVLNSKRLGWLRPGTLFINSSRPSVVDERALLRLMDKNNLTAALDVCDNPGLRKHERVFFTNHTAGRTLEDRVATDDFIVRKLEKILNA